MLLAQFILQRCIWRRKLHLKELLRYWTFCLWLFCLLPSFFYYTPAPLSHRLLLSASEREVSVLPDSNFFILFSTTCLWSSSFHLWPFRRSARSVVDTAFACTHTHTHTYSQKVMDWARVITHLSTDLSDWLYSHKVPRCPWNNLRLMFQRALNTAQRNSVQLT